MKILINCLVLVLFTSCFGLFDKKDNKVKLNPSGNTDAVSNDAPDTSATNEVEEVRVDIANQIVVVKVDSAFQGVANSSVDLGSLAQAIKIASDANPRLIYVNQFISAKAGSEQVIQAMSAANCPVLISGLAVAGEQKFTLPPIEVGENDGFVTEVPRVIVPTREIGESSSGLGVFELTGDQTNYQDMPLVVAKAGKLYPSSALKVLTFYRNEIPVYYKEYVTIGETPIKIQNSGSNGGGEFNGGFKTIGYSEFLSGSASADLQGKIIIFSSGLTFNYRGQARYDAEITASKVIELYNLL